jgi:hypothetical protein
MGFIGREKLTFTLKCESVFFCNTFRETTTRHLESILSVVETPFPWTFHLKFTFFFGLRLCIKNNRVTHGVAERAAGGGMCFLRAERMATAHGMCMGQSKDGNLGYRV